MLCLFARPPASMSSFSFAQHVGPSPADVFGPIALHLHWVFVAMSLTGGIAFVVWLLRDASRAERRNWTIGLLVAGILGMLLTAPAAALAVSRLFGGAFSPMADFSCPFAQTAAMPATGSRGMVPAGCPLQQDHRATWYDSSWMMDDANAMPMMRFLGTSSDDPAVRRAQRMIERMQQDGRLY